GADGEFAGLLGNGSLRVAEIGPTVDQLLAGQRLPAPQLQRTRENARQRRLPLSVQPRVDQFREADVVVRREETGDDERDGQDECRHPHPAFLPERDDVSTQAGDEAFRWRQSNDALEPVVARHPGGRRALDRTDSGTTGSRWCVLARGRWGRPTRARA